MTLGALPANCLGRGRSIESVDVSGIREWFRINQRDLPWRNPETTPWAILVSEVMLQQTPVSRVIPAWTSWLDRWPDAHSLAQAPLGDVLQQWGKLGYPRRAKNLHLTAQEVSFRWSGVVPESVDDLLALPGIGDYTARAIACFAYGQPHPVVDTNVKRVVARAIDGDAAAGHWSMRDAMARVDAAMDTPLSDEEYCLSQKALMELGAVVCTARSPRCDECPLISDCAWRASGFPVDPAVLPRVQARYEGSDRQVRGLILELLRGTPGTHPQSEIDALWSQAAQRERALRSLVSDGLIVESEASGELHYSLSWSEPYPGE
jgi:A/G-specific adenine glycosylase